MENKMYYLWSAPMSGWMTGAGTATTVLDDAKAYTESEAIALVKRHYKSGLFEFGVILVPASVINNIRSQS